MRLISYAQNREDVVLARGFSDDYKGFYVDVGAWDPVAESVTKLFYDRGWRGLNIEPSPDRLAAFVEDRPEDVNLGLGVADRQGEATFFEIADTGWSTFVEELAHKYADEGAQVTPMTVELTTLAALCEEHVGDRVIDFLKVDVEGEELAVLTGADFTRFRPRIVVVEAIGPIQNHHAWEPILLNAGYRFVLFDGLNRFYVREEDPELNEVVAAPANVFDDFVPEETRALEEWAHELSAQSLTQREALLEQSKALARCEEYVAAQSAEKIELLGEADAARRSAGNARDIIATLRAQADAARRQRDEARAERDAAYVDRDAARAELERLRQRAVMRVARRSRALCRRLRDAIEHR